MKAEDKVVPVDKPDEDCYLCPEKDEDINEKKHQIAEKDEDINEKKHQIADLLTEVADLKQQLELAEKDEVKVVAALEH